MKSMTLKTLKARKATLIATRLGISFYECPIYGDMEPLIGVYEGESFDSGFYDLPTETETRDLLSDLNTGAK